MMSQYVYMNTYFHYYMDQLHLMHKQVSKYAVSDFHKTDSLHQHNIIIRSFINCVSSITKEFLWLSKLITNDSSTDLKVLNALSREHS